MSQGGLDSRRAPGATRASQGSKAPFQNSFSSLSAPCSCFLHVYIISINPRSIQGRVCKYGIIGLLTMISTKLLLPIRHRILDSKFDEFYLHPDEHLVTKCVKYQSFARANCMILHDFNKHGKNQKNLIVKQNSDVAALLSTTHTPDSSGSVGHL